MTQPQAIPLDPGSLLASAMIGVAGQSLGQQLAALNDFQLSAAR